MVRSLFLMMRWKDSVSCDKAIAICQRIVAMLVGYPEFSELLGKEMLLETLRLLNEGYHAENHESNLSLIAALATNYRSQFEEILLNQLLGSTASESFTSFINEFYLVEDAKKKKALLKTFLKPITGVKASSLYKLDEDASTIKALEGTVPRLLPTSRNKRQHLLYAGTDSIPTSSTTSPSDSNESLGLSSFFK